MNLRCPSCRSDVEMISGLVHDAVCPNCDSAISVDGMLNVDDSATQTTDYNSTILEPGANIAHFRIDKVLGRGGFGTVYAAFDERLERKVALKIPRMNQLSLFQMDSFIREAQAAAQLRHPNIVVVHEVGKEGDCVYIVSDYFEGTTLADWNIDSDQNPKQAAEMISEIARAVHFAHEKGIVHRDLKPRNVLIDENGKPMITDFGLAKRENPEPATITNQGPVIGTPAYMSPEQAQGRAELADRRTDVYSLGVVLYEMLAGRRPFVGDSGLLIDEVIEGNAPPIRRFCPQTPRDLEAICLKSIAANPGERFKTALEFSEELDRFVNDQPTLTRPLSPLQRYARLLRVNLVPICVILALAASIGSVVYLVSSQPAIPDNHVFVEFKVRPPRADVDVAIVKVDLEKGHVDLDNVLIPETTDQGYSISLEPGWYIIEAHIPDYGIQEVWRYVPQREGDSSMSERANSSWERINKNHVKLREIKIHETVLIETEGEIGGEPMVLIRGAEFTTGSQGLFKFDRSPRRPPTQVCIQDFYYGRNEVCFENYHRVMQRRHYAMAKNYENGVIPDKATVTNISFYEALEYCERLGMRLPVFDEYLFAATNGGKTKFPWGDEMNNLDCWESRLIGIPEFDTTIQKPRVCNLFSSVLEWTQEVDLFVHVKTDVAIKQPFIVENENARIVVGGPPECLGNLPGTSTNIDPAFYSDVQPNEIGHNCLGFRCAKSVVPRLKVSPDKNKSGQR